MVRVDDMIDGVPAARIIDRRGGRMPPQGPRNGGGGGGYDDGNNDRDDPIYNEIKRIGKYIALGAAGLFGLIGLYGSFYTVHSDSVAVITRLGKYSSEEPSGLHGKIPFGIDKVHKVPVTHVQKEEFCFRTVESGTDSKVVGMDNIANSKESDIERVIEESGDKIGGRDIKTAAREILERECITLTGDLNLAEVELLVQYTIKDANAYLFNVREQQHTIRDCVQSAMKHVVGNGSVDEAITIGRLGYQSDITKEAQKLLDSYQTGVHIVMVKLQSSNPPARVKPAFNAVNQALQEKEKKINEAMKDYNTEVPKADGEAQGIIEKAQGYATKRTNEAKGDVARFNSVRTEYDKARSITRDRMYFETIERVFTDVTDKTIIDEVSNGREGNQTYKVLNLNRGEK